MWHEVRRWQPLSSADSQHPHEGPNPHLHHHLNGQRLIRVDFISGPLCNHRRLRKDCKSAAWQEPRSKERMRKTSKHLFALLSCLELLPTLSKVPTYELWRMAFHHHHQYKAKMCKREEIESNSKTADNQMKMLQHLPMAFIINLPIQTTVCPPR